MNNGRDSNGKRQISEPTVVACVVFQTRDPDHLVQLLREALTGIADQAPEGCPISPIVPPQTDSEDPWLKHPQAAEYLGISKSTLYRYACQQTIESRKLGGRLEYHRSTLDRFKNRQIRPARRNAEQGSIITRALGSGK
jgi:excisionase family DNA binding protein